MVKGTKKPAAVIPSDRVTTPGFEYSDKRFYSHSATANPGMVEQIKFCADAGDPEAERLLALIHELGLLGEVDESEAARLYTRAALRGLVSAQFQLARLYVEGRGVPQDCVSAYVWMSLASAAGHATARTLLPMFARLITKQEIAQAHQRVELLRHGKNPELRR